MEKLSVLLTLCEGNPLVNDGFPSQRASNAGSDIFFDASLNKRLNKQLSYRLFQTPWGSSWRHYNGIMRALLSRYYAISRNMDFGLIT